MNIEPLLAVTRRLAAPVDLMTMLEEVVAAATQVLDAERASVWLYEPGPHELVLQVSLDLKKVRVPADALPAFDYAAQVRAARDRQPAMLKAAGVELSARPAGPPATRPE